MSDGHFPLKWSILDVGQLSHDAGIELAKRVLCRNVSSYDVSPALVTCQGIIQVG